MENKERKYGFWNWGTGITIVIIIGVVSFLYLVYLTQQVNIESVVDNSYDAEVHHNDNLLAQKNAQSLSNPIHIEQQDNSVLIILPDEMKGVDINGKVKFMRPSNQSLDISADFNNPKEGILVYPISKFQKGKYDVNVIWEMNNTRYEHNQVFIFK